MNLPITPSKTAVLLTPFLVCIPLALAGWDETSGLAYDRVAIAEQGQVWRLFTAHWVHTHPAHAALNLAAWPLIFGLAHTELPLRHWALATLVCVLGVDAGLWWGAPGVAWYVGLSGVLHGLWALAALAVWRRERVLAGAMLLGIAAKLYWEQTQGAAPGSEAWIGHRVIVDAHGYGALAGLLYGIALHSRKRALPGRD